MAVDECQAVEMVIEIDKHLASAVEGQATAEQSQRDPFCSTATRCLCVAESV